MSGSSLDSSLCIGFLGLPFPYFLLFGIPEPVLLRFALFFSCVTLLLESDGDLSRSELSSLPKVDLGEEVRGVLGRFRAVVAA